jgi:hypothetical protein
MDLQPQFRRLPNSPHGLIQRSALRVASRQSRDRRHVETILVAFQNHSESSSLANLLHGQGPPSRGQPCPIQRVHPHRHTTREPPCASRSEPPGCPNAPSGVRCQVCQVTQQQQTAGLTASHKTHPLPRQTPILNRESALAPPKASSSENGGCRPKARNGEPKKRRNRKNGRVRSSGLATTRIDRPSKVRMEPDLEGNDTASNRQHRAKVGTARWEPPPRRLGKSRGQPTHTFHIKSIMRFQA